MFSWKETREDSVIKGTVENRGCPGVRREIHTNMEQDALACLCGAQPTTWDEMRGRKEILVSQWATPAVLEPTVEELGVAVSRHMLVHGDLMACTRKPSTGLPVGARRLRSLGLDPHIPRSFFPSSRKLLFKKTCPVDPFLQMTPHI